MSKPSTVNRIGVTTTVKPRDLERTRVFFFHPCTEMRGSCKSDRKKRAFVMKIKYNNTFCIVATKRGHIYICLPNSTLSINTATDHRTIKKMHPFGETCLFRKTRFFLTLFKFANAKKKKNPLNKTLSTANLKIIFFFYQHKNVPHSVQICKCAVTSTSIKCYWQTFEVSKKNHGDLRLVFRDDRIVQRRN